ncbi:MAG: c-type cytochrome, partial [Myxococcaceae bacterium]
PAAAKARKSPVSLTPEVLQMAMEHFADHCAFCHGLDGGGQTPIGQGLYPRAPDLRSAGTQDQSDGELFYVIENGVRLTGMPAFGQADGEEDSWKLVALIRRLPRLTGEEKEQMERFLPRSAAEIEAERAEEEFLRGEDTKAGSPEKHH